jgi:hypothetical protein
MGVGALHGSEKESDPAYENFKNNNNRALLETSEILIESNRQKW